MTIKVYPTQVEAVNTEDLSRVFTIKMEDDGVYNLQLHTVFDKVGMEILFDSIRNAIEILEIEK